MNIAITGAVWNGYAKWLPEFCEYIAKSSVQPNEVVIVLGADHGLTESIESRCKAFVPYIKFVHDKVENPNVGRLTNTAISHTKSEWIMPMDIDDLIMPDAIKSMSVFVPKADYLCISWKWHLNGKMLYRQSPLPIEIAKMTPEERQKVRINNNSPFRRKFWVNRKYDENNYMNLQYIAYLVEAGARFVKVPKVCIAYRQWHGSMYDSSGWRKEKPKVREAVLDMYRRLEEYYG